MPGVAAFVTRLAARIAADGQVSKGTSAANTDGLGALETSTTLTPAMLRNVLLEMGVAADAQNLALAEAFAHLGLPLTREALTGANAALARAPQASPSAYALARAWSLPTTPAALNALTAVTGGGAQPLPQQAMPTELMSWLSLAADAGMEAETLAAQLFLMAQGAGRSTERRLAQYQAGPDIDSFRDTRTTLLRLAQGSADKAIRQGADTLAAHIEGQQLINQAARRDPSGPLPFYFAVPVLFGDEPTLAEMRLGLCDEEQDGDAEAQPMRATLRLATARLGRVQADLSGLLAGTLVCRLGAEKPATVRLLQRNAGALASSLTALGIWQTSEVQCRALTDWPPLWHGGDALTAPRTCVDWRA